MDGPPADAASNPGVGQVVAPAISLVIWVPYPGLRLTFGPVAFSIHASLMVCPVVGIASNCHALLCWLPVVPVLIYRSTVTLPVIVLVAASIPTPAVPV